jgi:hypothetical protein
MMRLMPLLSLLIALPAAADVASLNVQPASFVSSSTTRPAADSLRLASVSPPSQLQTLSERDDTVSLPEVSVESVPHQIPAPQDKATAPLGAFHAIPWAVAHPSQAWRIVTPTPTDKASGL